MSSFVIRHRRQLAQVAFFAGAVAIAYWLIVVTGRVNQQDASRKSAAQANYAQCLASIPLLKKINDEFAAAEIVGHVILTNARETHMVSPKGSATYRQQQINISRLETALARGGVRLPIETAASCADTRDRALR